MEHRCRICDQRPFELCKTHSCLCEAMYVNRGNPRCVMFECYCRQKDRLNNTAVPSS